MTDLFCDNLLVILVETSEELCIEVFGSEFMIIGQRDSDGEETLLRSIKRSNAGILSPCIRLE